MPWGHEEGVRLLMLLAYRGVHVKVSNLSKRWNWRLIPTREEQGFPG